MSKNRERLQYWTFDQNIKPQTYLFFWHNKTIELKSIYLVNKWIYLNTSLTLLATGRNHAYSLSTKADNKSRKIQEPSSSTTSGGGKTTIVLNEEQVNPNSSNNPALIEEITEDEDDEGDDEVFKDCLAESTEPPDDFCTAKTNVISAPNSPLDPLAETYRVKSKPK